MEISKTAIWQKWKVYSFYIFQRTKDKPIQSQQLIEKPLEVTTKSALLDDVGWFQPITEDPIYNWVWADVDNYDDVEVLDEFHNGLTLSNKSN